MPKLISWSPKMAREELQKRFTAACNARKDWEYEWREAERAVFAADGGTPGPASENINNEEIGKPIRIGTNRITRNARYIHSQLATNPPMIVPKPTSNDVEDHRKAKIANKLIHWGLRQYNVKDTMDRIWWDTIIYGTGFGKTYWDPDSGEVLEFDEKSGEIVMEGDWCFSRVSPWAIYLDPGAATFDGDRPVKWLFEEFYMPYEEACYKFPDKLKLLEQYLIEDKNSTFKSGDTHRSGLEPAQHNVVRVLQYWEKGAPWNGLVGRFCWCVVDDQGSELELLTEVVANPARFKPKLDSPLPGTAVLPYLCGTDLDVPDTVYGKSMVAYAIKHQDVRNMLQTATLDILKAHGVARLVVFGGAEVDMSDAISNSPLDIIRVDGNQAPTFAPPVPIPQGMISFGQEMDTSIDLLFGINDSMLGLIQRETAGTAMTYASQQGNIIRHRLFIKLTYFAEALWKNFLNNIKHHWSTSRTVKVAGNERAYDTIDLKGTDIDGGYDITAEFGTSLSLDPNQRRADLLQMAPMLEKAGVTPKTLLKHMRLSDMDTLFDLMELGRDRQDEIFRKMVESGQYIAPTKEQDHASMLEYCQYYVMTAEFTALPQDRKALISKHMDERLAMTGKQAAAAQGQPTEPPASGAAMLGAGAEPPAGPPPGNLMDLLTK
jgi:hypothetical protein